ncbi:MAG: 1-acyl-sn-glycerol-3-phosphate acyltransferase [Gemmatimonadota bacterium]|nr:1-acyl-sn-glycerol-3-phosphate acyltransferase [Gemmatimonadota bacterium]
MRDTGYPRRGSWLAPRLASRLLAMAGWRVGGELPALPRFIIIVAPHTSNWDFPLGVLTMFAIDLRASWLGKHTLFRFPMGPILRWIGGEPIDRSAKRGTVGAAIENFRTRPQWVLALSPEGTRRRVDKWKTGFHRIAVGAGVPIVPVWIDYRTRVVGLGAPLTMGPDEASEVARVHALFHKEMARYPECFAEEGSASGTPAGGRRDGHSSAY